MNEPRKPAGRKAGKPESRWGDRLTGLQARRPESPQVGEPDPPRKQVIRHHWELEVHKLAVDVAMQIFELSKKWPPEEKFSLTDQARRSSRSVAAQIAEAWRKRKYEAAFVSKLNDAEGEAAETQDWVMFAVKCGYVDRKTGIELHQQCDHVLGKLTKMGNNPGPWLLNRTSPKPSD
jgi:four helix bundle protein